MKKIIIVGYPKSGNSWLTRLVAQLLDCPAKGFLYHEKPEMVTEGLQRDSAYVCYKSHHQWHELKQEDQQAKIICITRDPRDVSLSGRSYFKFPLGSYLFYAKSKNLIFRAIAFCKAIVLLLCNPT